MKKFYALSAVTSFLLVLFACGGSTNAGGNGGGGNPPPPPPPPPTANVFHIGAIPGFHGLVAITKAEFSLYPVVYASSINLVGTYNGVCQLTPNGITPPSAAASILYGGGTLDPTTCGTQFNLGDANNTPGALAAANASGGQLVVGTGTLTNLVVFDTAASTHVGSNSGLVEVWVRRGQAIANTGISCTLGQNHLCETSATFATNDGDFVIVTNTIQPGDEQVGLQYYLSKQ